MKKLITALIFVLLCFNTKTMENGNYEWNNLPSELGLQIVSYLPGKNKNIQDLMALKRVSKKFNALVNLHPLASAKKYWDPSKKIDNIDNLFVAAIQAGEVKLVKNLVDMNILGIDCKTKAALTIACGNGHKKIAKLLLRNGADINEKDNNNNTVLYWTADAIRGACAAIKEGQTPICLTCWSEPVPATLGLHNVIDTFKLLIKKKADINIKGWHGTVLSQIVESGNLELVALVLARGGSATLDTRDGNSLTPLMLAAKHGHTEIVKLLLQWGADKKIKSEGGSTALNFAQIRQLTNEDRAEIINLLST